jgi:P4 family phage/plasmid primase-like protien
MRDGEKRGPGGASGAEEQGTVTYPAQGADTVAEGAAPREGEGLLLGRTDDAEEFLERWRRGGPWVLTSIVPDGGKTATRTFNASERLAMRDWIEERQGRENIYFSVNDLARAVNKKAGKDDVAALRAQHVDMDPRPGEPLDAERRRAEKLLREFNPAPTVIIDSGGGFQGFWLGEEPEVLTAEAAVRDAELRNLHIETTLQADACHNIDRIMRLPGTVNIPGEKKRNKGRKPALARVVEADWSRRYRLHSFPRAKEPETAAGNSKAARVAAGPVQLLEGLGELPKGVSDRTKALIVNGHDPDDPGRWSDRSDLVLHVLCDLIRADTPDEQLMAVILDPSFSVSAHVLEQPKPEQYARRQVQRALAMQSRPGPVLVPIPLHQARAHREARRPHLLHHQQEFLDWDGAAYVAVADDTVRSEVWKFLETCRVEVEGKDGAKVVQPFVPIPDKVSATVDALKAVAHLPPPLSSAPSLRWLDGRAGPEPLDLLATRSGLLHLPTGDLLPATPALFTRNALDFAHDPRAPEPRRWIDFLHEVWPDDDEADCITALQEFMGYLLTPDTRLQKALMFDGPKRSGKGTIGRVMRRLVGEANTTAPSLNSLGGGQFGLEPLLAKQLAIISDMRLSNKTDEAALAENLLRITGEDPVSVNRKNKSALEVMLSVRFVVMTNELPKFADRSGALVGRFIVLPMRQSFYGREDLGLSARLMEDLPGILNWAVEGWRRVRASGRIVQPDGGREVAGQMADLASPFPAFVAECCDLGAELMVEKGELFRAFRMWFLASAGHPYRSPESVFARDLYSATDKAVRSAKPREDGRRVPHFSGVSLRPGAVRELERAAGGLPWDQ